MKPFQVHAARQYAELGLYSAAMPTDVSARSVSHASVSPSAPLVHAVESNAVDSPSAQSCPSRSSQSRWSQNRSSQRRSGQARFAALAAGALVCLAGVALPEAAHAGGYYIGPIGGKAVGRAGAFTARADDLSAVYYNPAGLSFLDGLHVQLDNKLSYNFFEFQRQPLTDTTGMVTTTFEPVQSETTFQPLTPLLGVGYGISDWAFALVAYAGSGVSNMDFPEDGPQRYMMVSREGLFVNYALNVAWQPTPKLSIGAGVQVVTVPSLRYQLVINGGPAGFGGDNPVMNNLDIMATVEGTDPFTLNAVLGVLYKVSPAFELGLSGQVLPSKIEAKGPISLDAVNYDDAVETYRGPDAADDVTLTLPLPMTARLGARYINRRADGSELFDIELDLTYETLSDVERFTMDSNGMVAEFQSNEIEIGTIQVEKQWNDTIGASLGGDFNAIQDLLTVRAGAYWESAASDPEYTNVDFITGTQLGGTVGASLLFGDLSLALAYEFRYQPEVTNQTAEGRVYQVAPLQSDATPVVNGGTYRAHSHSAAIGLAYKF